MVRQIRGCVKRENYLMTRSCGRLRYANGAASATPAVRSQEASIRAPRHSALVRKEGSTTDYPMCGLNTASALVPRVSGKLWYSPELW